MYALQSGCPLDCQNFSVADVIIYGSRPQYDMIVNRLSQIGPDCFFHLLKILSEKSNFAQYHNLPETCEGLTDLDQSVCHSWRNDYMTVARRIGFLINQIQRGGFENLPQGPDQLTSRIKDFLIQQENIRSCQDYELGEERLLGVLFPTSDSFPDIHSYHYKNYQIKKELDGSYTASFAVEYVARDDYDGPVPKNEVHEHYFERAVNCMESVKDLMRGPNGERLKIVLQDARQTTSCIPKHTIAIRHSYWASRPYAYESDISCPVNLHEVSHNFSLNDEYLFGFDCRVPQTNSIMSDENERFDNVLDGFDSSLFDPSHFNAIIYGYCSEREDLRLFRQCSELAYQESRFENSECLALKAECERQNILGRDKNAEVQRLERIIESMENPPQNVRVRYNRLNIDEVRRMLDFARQWPD